MYCFFQYLLNHFVFFFLGTLCEGKATTLFCAKTGYLLNILNATFGRTQNTGVGDCDTTTTIDKPCIFSGMNEVVYNCQDKRFCYVTAIPGKYGNPCTVGVTKYLNITYRCEKKGNHQKHPSIGVIVKRCSENMQQIYKITPIPMCDFLKVVLQFYGNHISAWVFSCKFYAYLHKTLLKKTSGGLLLKTFFF